MGSLAFVRLDRSSRRKTAHRGCREMSPRRLFLERLEDRALPSVSVLNQFAGMSINDTTLGEPPDTIVAAGPSHLVELVNTAIRIYSKSNGGVLSTRQLWSFFQPLGTGPSSSLSDPVVSYDQLGKHFIAGVLDFDLPGAGPSRFDFAVSNTSDPTAGWTFRRYDMNDVLSGVADFADFPRLGWNADAYVVSFNMFITPATYDHVDTLAIDKSSLTGHRYIVPGGLTNFTMAPATMHGSVAGDPMWFVQGAGADPAGDALPGVTVRAVKMTGVLSDTPTFTSYAVSVNPYLNPPLATQPGWFFNTNDARILNAAWRTDASGVSHLVASQAVGLVDGLAHARWYDIATGTLSQTVANQPLQQGNLNDPAHLSAYQPGVHTYFPAIEIGPTGSLGMTYMQSSVLQPVSVYVTGRTASDPAGTMEPGVLVKAGAGIYVGTRGGDFAGISVDPVNGTFWAANEYSKPFFSILSLWGTWIANFTVTGAATLRAATALAPLVRPGEAGAPAAVAPTGPSMAGGPGLNATAREPALAPLLQAGSGPAKQESPAHFLLPQQHVLDLLFSALGKDLDAGDGYRVRSI